MDYLMEVYQCSKCVEIYQTTTELRDHYSAVHLSYFPFACQYCPVWFVSASVFCYHFSREHDGREFVMYSNQKLSMEAELDKIQSTAADDDESQSEFNREQFETSSDTQSFSLASSSQQTQPTPLLDRFQHGNSTDQTKQISLLYQNSSHRLNNRDATTTVTEKPDEMVEIGQSQKLSKSKKSKLASKNKTKEQPKTKAAPPETKSVIIDEGSESITGVLGMPYPHGVSTVSANGGSIRVVFVEQKQPFGLRYDQLTLMELIDEKPTLKHKLKFLLWNCVKVVCKHVLKPWTLAAPPKPGLLSTTLSVEDACNTQPEPFKTWLHQFREDNPQICANNALFCAELKEAIAQILPYHRKHSNGLRFYAYV